MKDTFSLLNRIKTIRPGPSKYNQPYVSPIQNFPSCRWQKQTLLVDITLTAPQDYFAAISVSYKLRQHTGPIPKHLVSRNHLDMQVQCPNKKISGFPFDLTVGEFLTEVQSKMKH